MSPVDLVNLSRISILNALGVFLQLLDRVSKIPTIFHAELMVVDKHFKPMQWEIVHLPFSLQIMNDDKQVTVPHGSRGWM